MLINILDEILLDVQLVFEKQFKVNGIKKIKN